MFRIHETPVPLFMGIPHAAGVRKFRVVIIFSGEDIEEENKEFLLSY